MNIRLEKKEKCLATLSIEVPAEKVAEERSKVIKAFVTQARIPGFRPGKAPKAVIEKAASLAALNSKAKHSSLVPVIYTERRYVRKPRKSPPGINFPRLKR